MANNAKLPDLQTLIQAGINPKTGLPVALSSISTLQCTLKEDLRKQMRILDEQDAVNRYTWFNLPNGLTGQLLERILYYRGQGAFFYVDALEKFFFLPYALDGTLDCYGRFTGLKPLCFGGGTDQTEEKKPKPFLSGIHRNIYYDMSEEVTLDMFLEGAVILKDYTPQLSETIISRQVIQDPLLDAMAEAVPMARTSLLSNSGVKGVRVQDESQASQVQLASVMVQKGALTGNPWIPITAATEFQDLTNGTALKSEEYLLYLQALDNYRLSLYGLDNGGLFQKKSHMLEAEQEMNSANTKLTMQDGLTLRQHFCDLVNAIWGLGIWCEVSASVSPVIGVRPQDTNQPEAQESQEDTMEEEINE